MLEIFLGRLPCWIPSVLILLPSCGMAKDAPGVLKTTPANHSENVPTDIGKIVIVFDRNMRTDSHSLVEAPGDPFPPMVGSDEPWQDPVTFVLRVKGLEPNTTYAVQLNSERRKGFVAAADGAPLPPTVITFRTGAGAPGGKPPMPVNPLSEVPKPKPGSVANPLAAVREETKAVREEGTGGDPSFVIFERTWEAKEKAFSFLKPKGWKAEGGIFNVNPIQAGGPGNSLEPKCDLAVKKDDAGTVLFRWLPTYNCADLSVGQFAVSAGFFPQGSMYQGMKVAPLPTVEAFLLDLFKGLRPAASGVKVVHKEAMPELAELFRKLHKPVNDTCVQLGLPPMAFDAGGIVLEYTEGATQYQETLLTALVDQRGAAAMWSNKHTLAMRAPAGEARKWKPTFDILRQSIQFNPQWVAAVARAAGERGKMVQETMRYIQKVDQEIVANRQKVHSDIRYEDYLFLTGQEDYVNPYTKEVEVDTNEYNYRWTTAGGDRIYTDARDFDPNRVREISNVEWKKTPVRERE